VTTNGMECITLNKIHEDLISINKDLNRIRIFFDEDEFKLSGEKFLCVLRYYGILKQYHN